MKTATEIPAILTIHQLGPGQYMVRIDDMKYRPLAVAASKLLEDAQSLVVITPTSTKIIRSSGTSAGNGRVATPPREEGERALPPPDEVPLESLDQETQAAIREQEGHSLPGEAEQPAVTPEAGMRVVRRKRVNGSAGHPETCGRCRGAGKIRIIEQDGAAGEASCGVCQGAGVITRYGAR